MEFSKINNNCNFLQKILSLKEELINDNNCDFNFKYFFDIYCNIFSKNLNNIKNVTSLFLEKIKIIMLDPKLRKNFYQNEKYDDIIYQQQNLQNINLQNYIMQIEDIDENLKQIETNFNNLMKEILKFFKTYNVKYSDHILYDEKTFNLLIFI